MAFQKGVPRLPQAGRRAGTPNKRTATVQEYAKGIVEHPEVRAQLLAQALAGELPPVLMQMLFYYAYGKPIEYKELNINNRIDIRVTSTLAEAIDRAYPLALDHAAG